MLWQKCVFDKRRDTIVARSQIEKNNYWRAEVKYIIMTCAHIPEQKDISMVKTSDTQLLYFKISITTELKRIYQLSSLNVFYVFLKSFRFQTA